MSEFKTPQLLQLPKRDKVVIAEAPKEKDDDDVPKEEEGVAVEDADKGQMEPPAPEVQRKKPENKSPREDVSAKKERYDKVMSSIPYREPLGSAPADSRYNLEVIKGGSVVTRVTFKDKKYFTVGRIPACDIIAENPTVSRVHAILQFIGGNSTQRESSEKSQESSGDDESNDEDRETQQREKGFYIYDLGSTHGTYVNKNRLYPNRFYRLRVGHVIKFGNSARLYIVGGPEDDEEEESDKSVSELLKERLEKELERKKNQDKMEEVEVQGGRNVEEDGISWGMAEDAVEETESRENPFAMDFQTSELSLDNPKKTLRGWFEREGYDLEYDCREKAAGHFICRIDLPLDGPEGSKVFAEVELKGKKKEAVLQCALQACQILDKYGVLRQSHHESKNKRKNRDWADEDYYSSDEDTFLDRTGSVEKKREKRMREAGKVEAKVETYETLLEKHKNFQKEIDTIKAKIDKAESKAKQDEDDEVDPLDAFMTDLKSGAADVKKLKSQLRELTTEQAKNKKLLDIAKPALKPISSSVTTPSSPSEPSSAPVPQSTPEEPSSTLSEDNPPPPNETHTEPPKKPGAPIISGPRIQFKVSSRKLLLPQKPKAEEASIPVTDFKPDEDEEQKPSPPPAESKPIPESYPKKPKPSLRPSLKPTPPPELPESNDSDDEDEPLDDDEQNNMEEDTPEDAAKATKSKRVRHRPDRKKETKEIKYDYDVEDPKYTTWVPPAGQRGDGRTSLNDKLGY